MRILPSAFLAAWISLCATTVQATDPQPPSKDPKDRSGSLWYYPRDQKVFEYVEKRYPRPDGTNYPYGNYFQYEKSKPSRAALEYDEGFRVGLGYFTSWMPHDSSGFDTKKFYKKVSQRSKAYQLGVDVADFVFSLIQFEVDLAEANLPAQGPNNVLPLAANAQRISPEEAKRVDEHILSAGGQKALLELIGKKHLRPDGKYFPHGNHTPQYQFGTEINEAFNEGMRFFLLSMPLDSSGSATREFFKNSGKRGKAHQIGIAFAYEIYALHRFEAKRAEIEKSVQTTNRAQP